MFALTSKLKRSRAWEELVSPIALLSRNNLWPMRDIVTRACLISAPRSVGWKSFLLVESRGIVVKVQSNVPGNEGKGTRLSA